MVNDLTIELIKKSEALRLEAYKCSAGVWTIGYGNTEYKNGKKVKQGDKITKKQAEEEFKYDIERYEKELRPLITVKVTENEFGAILSLAYNLKDGINKIKNSTLLRLLNSNARKEDVANQFDRWVYAEGKKLDGLVKRRAKEKALFLS